MKPGDVVIVNETKQAGTITEFHSGEAEVLLANNDIWNGESRGIRACSQEEAEAAPREFDRFANRPKPARAVRD